MSKRGISDDNVHEYDDCAFISILCPDIEEKYLIPDIFSDNEHWFKKVHDNVINLDFWDIEKDVEYKGGLLKSFTPEQADKIIAFIEKNNDKHFLIHCHAGISRSSAVAFFIRDYYNWVDKYEFDNRYRGRKAPNQKVFIELKNAYERKYYGERE